MAAGVAPARYAAAHAAKTFSTLCSPRSGNLVAPREHCFRAFVAENDFVVAQECAVGDSFLAAEPENVRLRGHALGDFGIIRVQDRHVALELIFEHAHFGVGVFFECSVAVEVIGSEIQQHADFRAKRVDCFQLKAADFGDGHGWVGRTFD